MALFIGYYGLMFLWGGVMRSAAVLGTFVMLFSLPLLD